MNDRKPDRGERGQAALSLVAVLVAVVAAVILLQRTASLAERINAKAENIAKTGRGINTATDAVLQLDQTNSLAGSILNTAQPLEGKLSEIVRLAQSIDGLAGSINGTAGDINSTAKGINGEVSQILTTAQSINRGVAQINTNLDGTIGVAQAIKGDTGNILGQARAAHENAACIDYGLGGAADGHCQ